MTTQNMIRNSHSQRLLTMICILASTGLMLTGCSLGYPRGAKAPLSKNPSVLLVGDSLTVGGFGDYMEDRLIKGFGSNKVAVYGYCGASVEHFLKDIPVFDCRCGYRETTRNRKVLDNWKGGKPKHYPTRKLATLLKKHQPEVIIVQLGTNNFTTLFKEGKGVRAKQQQYFNRLAKVMVSTTSSVRRAVWIAPPDSAKYPSNIEKEVDNMIQQAAKKYGIYVIRSSKFTHYVMGKTGTDGLHYNTKSADEWANEVRKKLNKILPPVNGRHLRSNSGIRVTPPLSR